MILRLPAICAAFILSGCAAQQAEQARSDLVGQRFSRALSCIGVPDKHASADGADIAEWSHLDPASSTTVPLAALAGAVMLPVAVVTSGTISIGQQGSCNVIVTSRQSIITEIHLSGDNGGLSGRGADCEPILRGCE